MVLSTNPLGNPDARTTTSSTGSETQTQSSSSTTRGIRRLRRRIEAQSNPPTGGSGAGTESDASGGRTGDAARTGLGDATGTTETPTPELNEPDTGTSTIGDATGVGGRTGAAARTGLGDTTTPDPTPPEETTPRPGYGDHVTGLIGRTDVPRTEPTAEGTKATQYADPGDLEDPSTIDAPGQSTVTDTPGVDPGGLAGADPDADQPIPDQPQQGPIETIVSASQDASGIVRDVYVEPTAEATGAAVGLGGDVASAPLDVATGEPVEATPGTGPAERFSENVVLGAGNTLTAITVGAPATTQRYGETAYDAGAFAATNPASESAAAAYETGADYTQETIQTAQHQPGLLVGEVLGGAVVGGVTGRAFSKYAPERVKTGKVGRTIDRLDFDPGKRALEAGRRGIGGTRSLIDDARRGDGGGTNTPTDSRVQSSDDPLAAAPDGVENTFAGQGDVGTVSVTDGGPSGPDAPSGPTPGTGSAGSGGRGPSPTPGGGESRGGTPTPDADTGTVEFADDYQPPRPEVDVDPTGDSGRSVSSSTADLTGAGGAGAVLTGAGTGAAARPISITERAETPTVDTTPVTVPGVVDSPAGAETGPGSLPGSATGPTVDAAPGPTVDATPGPTLGIGTGAGIGSGVTPDADAPPDTGVTPDPTPTVTPDPTPDPTPEVTPDPTPTVTPDPDPDPDPDPAFTPDPDPDPDPDPTLTPDPDPDPDPDPWVDFGDEGDDRKQKKPAFGIRTETIEYELGNPLGGF